MDINVLTIILTIIGANIATLAIFTNIINKRIGDFNKRFDDLKDLFRAELKPINEKLDNHITDTDKKINELTKKVDRLLAQSSK